jgi:hypothetical protein
MDPREFEKAWGKMVAKAWSDQAFKARLLADPAAVLKEHGMEVPADVTIKVLEHSAKVLHLILPEHPTELSVDELSQVAGGATASEVIQTLSAILKQIHDTQENIISNIK